VHKTWLNEQGRSNLFDSDSPALYLPPPGNADGSLKLLGFSKILSAGEARQTKQSKQPKKETICSGLSLLCC
jgi:hypothetical protein